MKRQTLTAALALTTAMSAGRAYAGTNPPRPGDVVDADHLPREPAPRHRTFGMSMDLGVPDGAALGLVVRPRFDWLRIGAAVTHNGMAPGARLGVTFDPIDFGLVPTFTVEGGHYWEGTLPLVRNSPAIGYNYANFHLGLEVGSRASFRFFLRGGVSWLDVSTAHFQNTMPSSSSSIGDPSYSGWLAPSGKLGFSLYF
jgi:hypothetical protein